MVNVSPGKLIHATALLYWECIRKASRAFIRNWLILVGAIAAYLISKVAMGMFGWMGWGGGFLIGFIMIILISYYYSWISDAVRDQTIKPNTMLVFDVQLFFNIISVAFVLWIARMLVESLIQGMGIDWLPMMMQLGIVIVFNAIPETLYIHRFESLHALSHAAVFTRDNWIEWFFPMVVLLLPILFISGDLTLALLAQSQELLPAYTIIQAWSFAGLVYTDILSIVGVVIANWFMLFRGYLYQELESGTRRQRIYRSGM